MVSLRLFLAAFVFIVDAARPEHGAAGVLGLEKAPPGSSQSNEGKGIGHHIGNWWNGFTKAVGSATEKTGAALKSAGTAVGSAVGSATEKTGAALKSAGTAVGSGVGKFVDGSKTKFSQLADATKGLKQQTQQQKADGQSKADAQTTAIKAQDAEKARKQVEPIMKSDKAQLAAATEVVLEEAAAGGAGSDVSKAAQEALQLKDKVEAEQSQVMEAKSAVDEAAQAVVVAEAASSKDEAQPAPSTGNPVETSEKIPDAPVIETGANTGGAPVDQEGGVEKDLPAVEPTAPQPVDELPTAPQPAD
eukprot:TRINITY_DN7985_c0_g1_i1.p1 TRINITY_DN7985_c0_g1~~TRINITY_DN7985_c0_g1_i1.p1  ORF type:complete len:304 (-),score=54.61 TRINITY_DN7985_c0_g1_i1:146-1057(-)